MAAMHWLMAVNPIQVHLHNILQLQTRTHLVPGKTVPLCVRSHLQGQVSQLGDGFGPQSEDLEGGGEQRF